MDSISKIPLRRALPKDFVSKRRERSVEVSKVKPPSAPPRVVGRHLACDVNVPPGRADVERQATGARVPPRLVPRVLNEEFAAGQMDPEVLVGLKAKVPLTDGDEDRHLRDGVGAEVVQLRSIVVAQSPLMEPHEARDVARGGIRLCLLRLQGDPHRHP